MSNDIIKYESGFGMVELTPQTVKDYLVKGNGTVTDQEVVLFCRMCEAQKLNPFVAGEVYLIKFGTQPAQMVVGYDTYKRRAEENPGYLYKESGIVVTRGDKIVMKLGACIYPTEKLIGGWCKVHKIKGEREVVTYKEVGFDEYNKGNAIWKEKPCTMIEKVAISQALREAFPKDFEGLYTAEELAPAQYKEISGGDSEPGEPQVTAVLDEPITQEERQALFTLAYDNFGKEKGNELLKSALKEEGRTSTTGMPRSVYGRIMEKLHDLLTVNEGDEYTEPEETDEHDESGKDNQCGDAD